MLRLGGHDGQAKLFLDILGKGAQAGEAAGKDDAVDGDAVGLRNVEIERAANFADDPVGDRGDRFARREVDVVRPLLGLKVRGQHDSLGFLDAAGLGKSLEAQLVADGAVHLVARHRDRAGETDHAGGAGLGHRQIHQRGADVDEGVNFLEALRLALARLLDGDGGGRGTLFPLAEEAGALRLDALAAVGLGQNVAAGAVELVEIVEGNGGDGDGDGAQAGTAHELHEVVDELALDGKQQDVDFLGPLVEDLELHDRFVEVERNLLAGFVADHAAELLGVGARQLDAAHEDRLAGDAEDGVAGADPRALEHILKLLGDGDGALGLGQIGLQLDPFLDQLQDPRTVLAHFQMGDADGVSPDVNPKTVSNCRCHSD